MKISEKNGYFSELDDVLEASITDLPSDAFLTKYLVSVPIILLAFAMLFGKLNFFLFHDMRILWSRNSDSDDKLNQESSIQCAPNSAGHGYTHGLYECLWIINYDTYPDSSPEFSATRYPFLVSILDQFIKKPRIINGTKACKLLLGKNSWL